MGGDACCEVVHKRTRGTVTIVDRCGYDIVMYKYPNCRIIGDGRNILYVRRYEAFRLGQPQHNLAGMALWYIVVLRIVGKESVE